MRRATGTAGMMELAPSIMLGISIFLFVFINGFGLFAGYGVTVLTAMSLAEKTSQATTFAAALAQMPPTATDLQQRLFKFPKMTPVGGYSKTGADLYVVGTNIHTQKTTVYEANKCPANVDLSANIYECSCIVTHQIEPIFPVATAIPFLENIPGIGKPVKVSATQSRAIESARFFGALQTSSHDSNVASVGDATVISNAADLADWNYSTLNFALAPGQKIAEAGATVVSAQNAGWVSTSDSKGVPIAIKKGQRLTILVNDNTQWAWHNVDWTTIYGDHNKILNNNLTQGALTAKIGSSGEPFQVNGAAHNIEWPEEGVVFFRYNDTAFNGNVGGQLVQVLVTN